MQHQPKPCPRAESTPLRWVGGRMGGGADTAQTHACAVPQVEGQGLTFCAEPCDHMPSVAWLAGLPGFTFRGIEHSAETPAIIFRLRWVITFEDKQTGVNFASKCLFNTEHHCVVASFGVALSPAKHLADAFYL